MTRYKELLSLYLDGEPTENELNELALILKNDEKAAADFRQELKLWEMWSQENAPERSAEAFLAGLHTRLRAENDASDFERSVSRQLKERANPFRLKPLLAAAAVLVILLSLSFYMNPADVHTGLVTAAEAGPIQIQGECVCIKCTLRTSERCGKAIRYVDDNGNEHLIRLVRDPELKPYNKCFCRGPTQVLVEGEIVIENGERMLLTTALNIDPEKIP